MIGRGGVESEGRFRQDVIGDDVEEASGGVENPDWSHDLPDVMGDMLFAQAEQVRAEAIEELSGIRGALTNENFVMAIEAAVAGLDERHQALTKFLESESFLTALQHFYEAVQAILMHFPLRGMQEGMFAQDFAQRFDQFIEEATAQVDDPSLVAAVRVLAWASLAEEPALLTFNLPVTTDMDPLVEYLEGSRKIADEQATETIDALDERDSLPTLNGVNDMAGEPDLEQPEGGLTVQQQAELLVIASSAYGREGHRGMAPHERVLRALITAGGRNLSAREIDEMLDGMNEKGVSNTPIIIAQIQEKIAQHSEWPLRVTAGKEKRDVLRHPNGATIQMDVRVYKVVYKTPSHAQT